MNKGHQLYCDNFFTCVHLAANLLEHWTTIVGTTHHNRIGFPKDIVNMGALDGCKKGMSVSTIIDDKIRDCFVWLDNKPVFFIDTVFGYQSYTTVLRGLADGSRVVSKCS